MANAIAYTDEGSGVTLAYNLTGSTARISVADSGRGIPPEDLPHGFERFYREDKSRNHLTGGMGIGLADNRSPRGGITAESPLEEGSVFTVTLPVDNPHREG
jgi:signal transduction histidine kinase